MIDRRPHLNKELQLFRVCDYRQRRRSFLEYVTIQYNTIQYNSRKPKKFFYYFPTAGHFGLICCRLLLFQANYSDLSPDHSDHDQPAMYLSLHETSDQLINGQFCPLKIIKSGKKAILLVIY